MAFGFADLIPNVDAKGAGFFPSWGETRLARVLILLIG
jgi:hypothetical protein